MRALVATALLAGSLSGVAGADPLICNEPWQPPSHPPVHTPPCHEPPLDPPPPPPCERPRCDHDHGKDCKEHKDKQRGGGTGRQDTYVGVVTGYIVAFSPGENVSVRCSVRVDGSEVASTPTASGTTFATTQGLVTYAATDTQDVDVCAEWSVGSRSGTDCFDTTTTQVPPQEVADLVSGIADPLICPLLAGLSPGVPGVVDVDNEGDVALAGEPSWDCPPYGS